MDVTLTETRDQVAIYLIGIADRVKATLREEQRERVAAAKELALLAARANLPRLVRDLRGHDETIRKNTAALMGDTLDHRCAEPLMQALPLEEEPAVQAEICRSLAKIGGGDSGGTAAAQGEPQHGRHDRAQGRRRGHEVAPGAGGGARRRRRHSGGH